MSGVQESSSRPVQTLPDSEPAPRGGKWQTGMVSVATGFRLVAAPVVVALVLGGLYPAALGLFLAGALSDFLDGYLARRWRVTTATGGLLDTTADKLLVAAALIALVAAGRASPWVAFIIVGREILILGLRSSAATHGVLILASQLGRWKATTQFIAVLAALLALGPTLGPLPLYQWLLWVAALLTVISAADYLGRFWSAAAGRRR